MKTMSFLAGSAAGYLLGARVGPGMYELLAAAASKARNHPLVAELQEMAKDLCSGG